MTNVDNALRKPLPVLSPLAPALEIAQAPKGDKEQQASGYQNGGPSAHVESKMLAGQIGKMPATSAAAAKMLREIGVQVSHPLKSEGEIAEAHSLLTRLYKGVYTETLAAEVGYAQDSRYEIRTVKDAGSKEAFGDASGWHLGKTGFQIDYLSPIEHPRQGQEARDITAGLALMKQMATRHHANALWVEVDDEMRKNYEKAGFKDFAKPNADDPAQLTMMVLPLNNEMKARLEKEPNAVWLEHIDAWYKANWDTLKGQDAAPARDALEKMRTDAKAGVRTWFQALPE